MGLDLCRHLAHLHLELELLTDLFHRPQPDLPRILELVLGDSLNVFPLPDFDLAHMVQDDLKSHVITAIPPHDQVPEFIGVVVDLPELLDGDHLAVNDLLSLFDPNMRIRRFPHRLQSLGNSGLSHSELSCDLSCCYALVMQLLEFGLIDFWCSQFLPFPELTKVNLHTKAV
jgi:hypothetical protein